jgi:activator of HSP90 ATPase
MKEIRRTIHIKASRETVFNAITNPLTIELWSGYPAIMESAAGTEFSLFDGDITGKILSLQPPDLIEQEWYFGDQPDASIVRLELSEDSGKTKIDLRHTNIPDEAYDNISTGWKEYYLGALKSYLEEC